MGLIQSSESLEVENFVSQVGKRGKEERFETCEILAPLLLALKVKERGR